MNKYNIECVKIYLILASLVSINIASDEYIDAFIKIKIDDIFIFLIIFL